MTTKRTVAAAHVAPVFMDKDATIDKAIEYIIEAGKQGVELLVFPEVFVPGYPYWIECFAPLDQVAANAAYTSASIEVPGPEVVRVQVAAKQAGVAVVLGASERLRGTRTCFNSQIYIERDGTLVGVHRKLQPTYVERIIWAQGGGATLQVHDMQAGAVGGLACWEHTMNLARQSYIQQGQQIHAAAWPALSTMQGFEPVADIQIEGMMRNHALTAQVFVVTAANPVDQTCLDWIEQNLGHQDKVTLGGGWSAVTHPFNAHLAGPHTGAQEQLVVAEIYLADLDIVKAWVDSRGHYARPEVLRSAVDVAPLWHDELTVNQPLSIDAAIAAIDVPAVEEQKLRALAS